MYEDLIPQPESLLPKNPYVKKDLFAKPAPLELGEPIDARPPMSEAGKSMAAFVDETQSLVHNAGALGAELLRSKTPLGDVFGEGLTKFRDEQLAKGQAESIEATAGRQAPKIARIEDIESVGDFGNWLAYQLPKGIANVAMLAGPAMLGRGAAKLAVGQGVKALAKKSVVPGSMIEGNLVTQEIKDMAVNTLRKRLTAGTIAGGVVGGSTFEAGNIYGEAAEKAGPEAAATPAFVGGGIAGALEFLPLYHTAKAIGMGTYAKAGIRKALLDPENRDLGKAAVELARRVGKAGAVGAGVEGITEALQELVGIASVRWAKNDPLFADLTDEDWSRVWNSMAAGAAVGGALGGAGGVFAGPRPEVTPPGTDIAPADERQGPPSRALVPDDAIEGELVDEPVPPNGPINVPPGGFGAEPAAGALPSLQRLLEGPRENIPELSGQPQGIPMQEDMFPFSLEEQQAPRPRGASTQRRDTRAVQEQMDLQDQLDLQPLPEQTEMDLIFGEYDKTTRGTEYASRKSAENAAKQRGIENFEVVERPTAEGSKFVIRDLGPEARPVREEYTGSTPFDDVPQEFVLLRPDESGNLIFDRQFSPETEARRQAEAAGQGSFAFEESYGQRGGKAPFKNIGSARNAAQRAGLRDAEIVKVGDGYMIKTLPGQWTRTTRGPVKGKPVQPTDTILQAARKVAREVGGFAPEVFSELGLGTSERMTLGVANNNGATVEHLAESLSQYGYDVLGPDGKWDQGKMLDLLNRELRGDKGGSYSKNVPHDKLAELLGLDQPQWESPSDIYEEQDDRGIAARRRLTEALGAEKADEFITQQAAYHNPEWTMDQPIPFEVILDMEEAAAKPEADIPFGSLYSRAGETIGQSEEEMRVDLRAKLGDRLYRKLDELGLLRFETGAPAGAQGRFDKARGTTHLYGENMAPGASATGVYLHEGSHAGLNRLLDGKIEEFVADIIKLGRAGNTAAQEALVRAEQQATAQVDAAGLTNEVREAALRYILNEETAAYYVELAFRNDSFGGVARRILTALQGSFSRSAVGRALRNLGIGFELTPALAVDYARAAVQETAETVAQIRKYEKILANRPGSVSTAAPAANTPINLYSMGPGGEALAENETGVRLVGHSWITSIPEGDIYIRNGIDPARVKTLGDVIESDKLFAAQPWVKDIKVGFRDLGEQQSARIGDTIYINSRISNKNMGVVKPALLRALDREMEDRGGWRGFDRDTSVDFPTLYKMRQWLRVGEFNGNPQELESLREIERLVGDGVTASIVDNYLGQEISARKLAMQLEAVAGTEAEAGVRAQYAREFGRAKELQRLAGDKVSSGLTKLLDSMGWSKGPEVETGEVVLPLNEGNLLAHMTASDQYVREQFALYSFPKKEFTQEDVQRVSDKYLRAYSEFDSAMRLVTADASRKAGRTITSLREAENLADRRLVNRAKAAQGEVRDAEKDFITVVDVSDGAPLDMVAADAKKYGLKFEEIIRRKEYFGKTFLSGVVNKDDLAGRMAAAGIPRYEWDGAGKKTIIVEGVPVLLELKWEGKILDLSFGALDERLMFEGYTSLLGFNNPHAAMRAIGQGLLGLAKRRANTLPPDTMITFSGSTDKRDSLYVRGLKKLGAKFQVGGYGTVVQEFPAGADLWSINHKGSEIASELEKTATPVGYALRTKPEPKNYIKVYKAFREIAGQLYPMFIGARDPLPQDTWLDATEGGYHFVADNGIAYTPTTDQKGMTSIKIPNDQVRQELIDLGYLPKNSKANSVRAVAYRPGWHGGDLPFFPQSGVAVKDKKGELVLPVGEGYPYPNVHKGNTVIAEVYMDADKNYKDEYESTAVRTKAGKINHKASGLRYIPEGGFYEYATNPLFQDRPELGKWYISGSMKIGKVLSRDEANAILDGVGVPRQRWLDEDGSLYSMNWVSPIAEAVKGLQAKGTGAQYKAMLQKAPGVKKEEGEDIGLWDWLDGMEKVTRDEIEEFVRQGGVKVEEVVKDGKTQEDINEEANAYRQILLQKYGNGIRLKATAEEIAELDRLENQKVAIQQYRSYQESGGKNYRELLITIPNGINAPLNWVVKNPDGVEMARFVSEKEAMDAAEEQGESYDWVYEPKDETDAAWRKPNYQSSHWDEPNVLVHLRFNERMLDGKHTLFVEEVQSDWHQEGRKKGYGESIPQTGIDSWANPMAGERVPDAPFKSSWPLLGMKRAIAWAAQNGFEQVAWTGGEIQADRYNLAQQVDHIDYKEVAPGQYQLGVVDTTGEEVQLPKDVYSAVELEDIVGRDIANRIVSGEGQPGGGRTTLRGVELSVGGEGMTGFYDKILPSTMKKFLGKRSEVRQTYVEGKPVWAFDMTDQIVEQAMAGMPLYSIAGTVGLTQERVENLIRKYGHGIKGDRSKASIAWINPAEFVRATTTGKRHEGQIYTDAGELDRDRITVNRETPYLTLKDNEIIGHEGRHRMAALARAGVEKAPVVLETIGYSDAALSNRRLIGQDFAKHGKGESVTVSDVVPLAWDYEDKINARHTGLGFLYSFEKSKDKEFRKNLAKTVKSVGLTSEIASDKIGEFLQKELGINAGRDAARFAFELLRKPARGQVEPPSTATVGVHADLADSLYSFGDRWNQFRRKLWMDRNDPSEFNELGAFQRAYLNYVDNFATVEAQDKGVYDVNDLAKTKASTQIDEINRRFFDPLKRLVAATGLSVEQVNDWLAARHILLDDVNRKMAERAAFVFTEDLLPHLSKEDRKALKATRKHLLDGKDAAGNTLTPAEVRRQMKELVDFYVEREIPSRDPKINNMLRKVTYFEWKHFKEHASGMYRPDLDRFGNPDPNGIQNSAQMPDAFEIYNKYKDRADVQAVASKFDELTKHQLILLRDGGLITDAEMAKMIADKPHYVSLRRAAYDYETAFDFIRSRGTGPSKGVKTRYGSPELLGMKPVHVIQNALAKAHGAAAAGQRNLANNYLYEQIMANQDHWKNWFEHPLRKPTRTRMDKLGFVKKSESAQLDEEDVLLIRNGRQIVLKPIKSNQRASMFAAAVNKLSAENFGALSKVFGFVNSIVRFTAISASVPFLVTNMIRDPLTAGYNMQASEASKYTKEIYKNYGASFRALRRVFLQGVRDPADPDVQMVEAWERAGGRISFVQSLREMENGWRDFKAAVGRERTPGVKQMIHLFNKIEDANIAVENIMRLATFTVLAKDPNIGEAKAARIAKDLTTNFSRKGFKSAGLGMLYLFFNATVQGNAQVIRNMMGSKKLQAMVGGTIGLAMVLDMIGRATADEDDDGENEWDKIPLHEKERNIVLPFKVGEEYVKIPAPWVFNVAWRLGGMLGENAAGVRTLGDTAGDTMALIATTFNPMGGKTFAQFITPTALDPLVQSIENKDFAGNTLRPFNYPGAGNKPNAELAWANTPDGYKWLARYLNEKTGGDVAHSGWLDVAPADYQNLVNFFGGGLVRFLGQVVTTAQDLPRGEAEIKNVPILRQFAARPGNQMTTEKYYDLTARVMSAEKTLQAYKAGPERDPQKYAEAKEKYAKELRMVNQVKDVERQIKSLRTRLRAAQGRGDDARVDELKARIASVQSRLNATYDRRVGG